MFDSHIWARVRSQDVGNLNRLMRNRHWTGNGSSPKMPAYVRKLARVAVRNVRQSTRDMGFVA